MTSLRARLSAACVFALAACTVPGSEVEPAAAAPAIQVSEPALWDFATSADTIRATSCADGGAPMRGLLPLKIDVAALNDAQVAALSERLPQGAALAGAWELTSPDPNFGGLSGLAIEDASTLLAITDAGGWVKLGLDGNAPSAATIGYMRGADGKFLAGKGENDAEGLALRDGIALVSFERDFRIEAFALGTCGASAKAVEIASLPDTFDNKSIDSNEGPEALALLPDGSLSFGFEGASSNASPLGRVASSGNGEWTGLKASNPPGFALVGLDSVSLNDGTQRDIYLYRAFDPIRGARSVLTWGLGDTQTLTLSRPVLTDNFEGLAAEVRPTGELRVWIVSDNNFSKLQRTLIYAFDLPL